MVTQGYVVVGDVGKRFFDFFSAAGVSQRKLAAVLGVNPSALSHWRAGRGVPSLDAIAYAVREGADANYILCGVRRSAPPMPPALAELAEVWAQLSNSELQTITGITAAAQARARQKNSS